MKNHFIKYKLVDDNDIIWWILGLIGLFALRGFIDTLIDIVKWMS